MVGQLQKVPLFPCYLHFPSTTFISACPLLPLLPPPAGHKLASLSQHPSCLVLMGNITPCTDISMAVCNKRNRVRCPLSAGSCPSCPAACAHAHLRGALPVLLPPFLTYCLHQPRAALFPAWHLQTTHRLRKPLPELQVLGT